MILKISSIAALAIAGSLAGAAPASARPWHHHFGGGALGAGIGLAAGALIGGAIANSYAGGYGYYGPPRYAGPEYYAGGPGVYAGGSGEESYCASRFRSYDPASGTYLGFDGVRHSCP